jgi:integrase
VSAKRMKMRRPHRVPLPRQVLGLLDELHRISGTSAFLFSSARSWKTPVSQNMLNAAIRGLG